MLLRQLYDRGLAQASYLIGCQKTGEAIVVDPLRDVGTYVDAAAAEGLRVTHVTETHIHADFVSGARELAARTGAQLLLSGEGGEDWRYRFAAADGASLLHDGDVVVVGNLRLDVWHTPGHTPEHLSFLVTDAPRSAAPLGMLTGDFVFVGDVGRPDLLERAAHVEGTMEASARQLFASLQRFRALPDHLLVWPGHGAGSACGKALGAVPHSTVGYEKLASWALAIGDEGEFVRTVLTGQPEPPAYFAVMKQVNRDGPRVLGETQPPARRSPRDITSLVDAGAWILDLRSAPAFAAAHVPGSLSLPYGRSFTNWAGTLVPYGQELVLVGDDDDERTIGEAARALRLIGLDDVSGWVDATSAESEWLRAGRALATLPQLDIRSVPEPAPFTIVDVRERHEWDAGHRSDALHLPLSRLAAEAHTLPAGAMGVHCQSGVRSAIATSLLHRLGRTDALDLTGGYGAWALLRKGGRGAS